MAITLHPNLADDPTLAKRWATECKPLFGPARDEKNSILRPQFLRYDRLWNGRHDSAAYRGNAKLYLKTGRRIIENWVQKLTADLFPQSGRWFETVNDLVEDADKVPTVQSLLRRFATREMQLRRQQRPWLRTLCTLGTAPSAVGWKVQEALMPVLEPLMDPVTGEMTAKTTERAEHVLRYLGPTWRPVSPYLFYVWPVTTMRMDDATLVFEDTLMEQSVLRQMAKTPIAARRPSLGMQIVNLKGVEELLNGPADTQDKFQAERVRLAARGFTSRSEAQMTDASRPIDCTRFYWKTMLDEHDTEPVWYTGLVAGDSVLLQLRRCPWWHLAPEYLAAVFLRRQDEFWGYGLPDVFDDLQYFLNDIMNQTGDGLVYSLNPITALDPAMVQEPQSIRRKPGARWLVRNPAQAIHELQPPLDIPAMGMQAVGMLQGLMNDVANVAPFSGGGGTPRARGRAVQTATGAQLITGEAQLQVRDVVEGIEDEHQNPLMNMSLVLTLQCLDRSLLLRVEGRDGAVFEQKKITRADLTGAFTIRWTGSQASYNQNVRTAQRLQFLQIASGIPPQVLQQQNVMIDYKALLRDIYAEGFDSPDAHRIIKDAQPVTSLDPLLENELFRVGHGAEVTVSPGDNHLQHAKQHDLVLADPRIPPAMQQLAAQHIQAHVQAAVQQMMAQQAQAQMQAMQQQGMAPPGMPSGNGNGNGAAGGGAAFNPGRPPSTATSADVMRQASRPGIPAAPGSGVGG